MKETSGCCSVDGENFNSGIKEGYLKSAPDSTPFQRSLGHIEARNAKIMALRGKDFEPYEGVESVTLS